MFCIVSGYDVDGLKEYTRLITKVITIPFLIEGVILVTNVEIMGVDQYINIPLIKGFILLHLDAIT